MWEGETIPDDNPFREGSFMPPAQSISQEPEVLTVLPPEGLPVCDRTFGGDSQLTHVPMNIVKYMKGRWQTVFDDVTQQTCLMQQVAGADAEHMVLASEVLEWDLYKHDTTGERFMVGHAGGKHAGQHSSLDQKLCMHMEADVVVTVMSSVETSIPVSVFRWQEIASPGCIGLCQTCRSSWGCQTMEASVASGLLKARRHGCRQ